MSTINYYGFNAPFFGGHQNILSRQAGDRIIKNDLLQLIMTSPGERAMRPDYGTKLKSFLMEPLTDDKIMELITDLSVVTKREEPRVSVSYTAVVSADKSMLTINANGRFTDQPNQLFEFEVNIPLNKTTNNG